MSVRADAPEGAKPCTKCGKVKPLGAFGPKASGRFGVASICRACKRIDSARHRATPEGRAAVRAYNESEAGRASRLAYRRRNAGKALDALRRYRSTPLGKVITARQSSLRRLRSAASDESRERIARTIALYDAEIARLRRDLAGDGKPGRPPGPGRNRAKNPGDVSDQHESC